MTTPTLDELRSFLAHDAEIQKPIDEARSEAAALAAGLDEWHWNAELHRDILDSWHATAEEATAAREFLAELRQVVDAVVYGFTGYASGTAQTVMRGHLRAAFGVWLGVDELADCLESHRAERELEATSSTRSIDDVATLLGIDRSDVLGLIRDGKLSLAEEGQRIDRWTVELAEVRRYLGTTVDA